METEHDRINMGFDGVARLGVLYLFDSATRFSGMVYHRNRTGPVSRARTIFDCNGGSLEVD